MNVTLVFDHESRTVIATRHCSVYVMDEKDADALCDDVLDMETYTPVEGYKVDGLVDLARAVSVAMVNAECVPDPRMGNTTDVIGIPLDDGESIANALARLS